MMWAEFEKLAGFEVSHDVYHNVIEPMYNALPESYTKQDFIRMLNPAAFKVPIRRQIINCGSRSFRKWVRGECRHLCRFCRYRRICELSNR